MNSSTKNAVKPLRDIAYYRRRFQNRVFASIVAFVKEEVERDHISKKDLAERMGKDPGQLSRLLGTPSNLTLDSISDLLLALDAEAEPPQIIAFRDRRPANYMHPLMVNIIGTSERASGFSVASDTTSNIHKKPMRSEVAGFSTAAE